MSKIRDTDYLTASARVRAMERGLLTRERALGLVEARSHEDAVKILLECGYPEPAAYTAQALEQTLSAARAELYATASQFLPKALLDTLRVRFDYHNLKVLVKAEAVGEDAQRLLIDCGRVPVKQLLEAYPDFVLREYPAMLSEAALDARDLLARTQDPQMADFLLDRCCAREQTQTAKDSGSKFLQDYVALNIDVMNLKAVVRAARIQKGPDFLRQVLADGGNVGLWRLQQLLVSGGSLPELFVSTPLEKAAEEGVPAMRGEIPLTAFERLADDALVTFLKKAKYVPFGPEPILAYVLTREGEQTTVRTVMNGRFAGVSPEDIRERLRESYV